MTVLEALKDVWRAMCGRMTHREAYRVELAFAREQLYAADRENRQLKAQLRYAKLFINSVYPRG